MDAALPPRGLIVDLITPLTAGGIPDLEGLGRLIKRVAPYADGILAAGPSAGEGYALDSDARAGIMDAALAAAGGKVPLFIWITADGTEKTFSCLETLEHAAEKVPGDMLYWMDTPLFYHSNRGLAGHYEEMSKLTGRHLVLHNDPEFITGLNNPLKRVNIRTAILKELANLKFIAGLVFSGSMDRARNYQKACRLRPGFRIYDQNEGNFLDFPSMSGAVSIGSNLAPREWHRITETSLRRTGGDSDYPDFLHQIWETGRRVRALREIYMEAPVPVVKGALHRMGVISSPRTTDHCQAEVSGAVQQLLEETGDAGKC